MAKILLGNAVDGSDVSTVNFFAFRNLVIMREAQAQVGLTMETEVHSFGTLVAISGPVDRIAILCENLHDQYGIGNLNIETYDLEEREFLLEAMDDGFWQAQLDDSRWEED